MKFSVINFSECAKYDFGHFLWAPDFFQEQKLRFWDLLQKKASHACHHYFMHVKKSVKQGDLRSVAPSVICYDLTDGLPKFFDGGIETDYIGSAKKQVAVGDFVISKLRSYLEEMGIIEERGKTQVLSTDFLVFRQKSNALSTHALFALCMTDMAQHILKGGQHGTGHPRFYDFLLENFPIPDSLLAINDKVSQMILKAQNLRNLSRKQYLQSQKALLSELGLCDWQPKHRLAFVKNHSDVVEAERFDAEYFQPKYEDIVKAVKSYKGGYDILSRLVNLKNDNFTPADKAVYKYIALADVSGNGEVTGCISDKGKDLPTRARRMVNAGDVIVSSIEGSLSSIAIVEKEYDGGLCSTGFHVINSKILNSETLLIFLKSGAGQLLLKKGCNGTILTSISKEEFKKIPLPLISQAKQQEIQKKVRESFSLRAQSKKLLENAKRTVEIAIERGEKAALDWLDSQK